MAVLHVVQYSQPQMLAGYTIRTQAIVEAQLRLGLDPLVLTSPRHPSGDEEVVGGVRHFRCQPERAGGSPWLRDARRVKRLAARIREVAAARPEVQVLHAHSPVLCGLAALRAAARLDLPVVYEVRGLWEEPLGGAGPKPAAPSLRYRLARRLETHLCHRAHAVVTISEGLRQEFVARGIPADKIQVVGNGVDVQAFQPRPLPGDWRGRHGLGDGPLLLYLGAVRQYEGVHVLVEAFREIRKQHPSCQLMIVGAGETTDVIARLAAAQPGVHLHEAIPHARAAEFYAAADLVVYPRLSTRATELVTPLKPLEALAMGKPIIASQVGGLRELLADSGAAVWVPPGDASALARACIALVGDDRRRSEMSRLARARAVNFDWATIIRRYQAVYDLAERTRRGVLT